MKSSRTLSVIAILLVVLGVAGFALQPVLDPRPESTCVEEGEPSSGFTDDDKDCNISMESWEEISEWESSPKPWRIGGAALVFTGIVLGIVALVRGRRHPGPPGAA